MKMRVRVADLKEGDYLCGRGEFIDKIVINGNLDGRRIITLSEKSFPVMWWNESMMDVEREVPTVSAALDEAALLAEVS